MNLKHTPDKQVYPTKDLKGYEIQAFFISYFVAASYTLKLLIS